VRGGVLEEVEALGRVRSLGMKIKNRGANHHWAAGDSEQLKSHHRLI